MKAIPTLKQVEAARAKYDLLGLRIEKTKQRLGYKRGNGVVGELQIKKGKAYSEWCALKAQYEADKNSLRETTDKNSLDFDFSATLMKILGIDGDRVNEIIEKLDVDNLSALVDACIKNNVLEVKKIVQKITKEENEQRKLKSDNKHHKHVTHNIGDKVNIDDEEATVKIPHGPRDTIGVMINGELKMVKKKNIRPVKEGILGMSPLPGLGRPSYDDTGYEEDDNSDAINRMRELAGIHDEPEPVSELPSQEPMVPPEMDGAVDDGANWEDDGIALDDLHTYNSNSESPAMELPMEAEENSIDDSIAEIERLIPNVKISEYKGLVSRLRSLVSQAEAAGRAALTEAHKKKVDTLRGPGVSPGSKKWIKAVNDQMTAGFRKKSKTQESIYLPFLQAGHAYDAKNPKHNSMYKGHEDSPSLDVSFHNHEMDIGPDKWDRWIAQVEKEYGGSVDGDGNCGDGVCLDYAYDAFEAGRTPSEYLEGRKFVSETFIDTGERLSLARVLSRWNIPQEAMSKLNASDRIQLSRIRSPKARYYFVYGALRNTMPGEIKEENNGEWADPNDHSKGFNYDYAKIARETGYSEDEVRMRGVAWCRNNPVGKGPAWTGMRSDNPRLRRESKEVRKEDKLLPADAKNKNEPEVGARKTLMDYVNEANENMQTIGTDRNSAVNNLKVRMGKNTTTQAASAAFDNMTKAGTIKQNGPNYQMSAMGDDDFQASMMPANNYDNNMPNQNTPKGNSEENNVERQISQVNRGPIKPFGPQ